MGGRSSESNGELRFSISMDGLPPVLVLQSCPLSRKSPQTSRIVSNSLLAVDTRLHSCSREDSSEPASLCLPAIQKDPVHNSSKEGSNMPRGNISAARALIIPVSGSSHDSIEGIPSKLQTGKVVPSEWAKQTMYILEKFSGVSYEGYELNIPVSVSSYEQEALNFFFCY